MAASTVKQKNRQAGETKAPAVASQVEVTPVLFRVHKKDGDVTAVFPMERGTMRRDFMCYAHVGQHSSCDPEWVRLSTRPATEAEAAPLKKELEVQVGYTLKVHQKLVPGITWMDAERTASKAALVPKKEPKPTGLRAVAEPKPEPKIEEILGHRVSYSYRDGFAGEMDEDNLRHVKGLIRQGVTQGELNTADPDADDVSHGGWWNIEAAEPSSVPGKEGARTIEILQHEVSYTYTDGFEGEWDEADIAHVTRAIEQGFTSGELSTFDATLGDSHRGWWEIR